ncbi:MAG: GYD domain-containing protein [Methanosarcinaceae archaeon]|nr:GYD domain-containing protein [Methanosarcinaceae archaeon]
MPKYLFEASYTVDGLEGLLKDGGSKRREDLQEAVKQLGGTLEAIYFAFGDEDVFSIADMPDNVSANAIALAITATGAARIKTVVLLTPEEVDQATKKSVKYRALGK